MKRFRIVDSSHGLLCVRLHGFGFSLLVNDYRIVRLCASSLDKLVYEVEVFSVSTGSWKEEVENLEGVTLSRSYGFTTDGAIFWFGSKPEPEDTSAAGERKRWSWTKKYTSNPHPCFLSPRTIWRNPIVSRVHRPIKKIEGEVQKKALSGSTMSPVKNHEPES
ncbi:hypothetical protein K1719_028794 [Acacia pycnantha]|nr:hypothetical protein K1719_028794 [Acacia pycnantha]